MVFAAGVLAPGWLATCPQSTLGEGQPKAIHLAYSTTGAVTQMAEPGVGTGTGASPIVARVAKGLDALPVGAVPSSFGWEGSVRAETARMWVGNLKQGVDTLMVIPNSRLSRSGTGKVTLQAVFLLADDVLRRGTHGTSDLITVAGLVNVEFAEVRAITTEGGAAMMAPGRARGENRGGEGGATSRLVSSSGCLCRWCTRHAFQHHRGTRPDPV